MSTLVPEPIEQSDIEMLPNTPWITIVWNDPVNLMSYVSFVFQSYFKFSAQKAHQLMLQVHELGKAVVAVGSKEEMERHVVALHGYGLQATFQKEDA
ncbi:MAG: ATP-dependent Clp protease adapter ClpS [Micrococcaceae bacterium]